MLCLGNKRTDFKKERAKRRPIPPALQLGRSRHVILGTEDSVVRWEVGNVTCHKVELRMVCGARASFRAGLCKLEVIFFTHYILTTCLPATTTRRRPPHHQCHMSSSLIHHFHNHNKTMTTSGTSPSTNTTRLHPSTTVHHFHKNRDGIFFSTLSYASTTISTTKWCVQLWRRGVEIWGEVTTTGAQDATASRALGTFL